MTYTNEHFEKHVQYIEKEMAKYSYDQRRTLIDKLRFQWPSDAEVAEAVTEAKKRFDKELEPNSPELDEIMKYL